MANQHPPSPAAAWVDTTGRPMPEVYKFIDDLSQRPATVATTTPPPPAPSPAQTLSPLYAQSLGWTLGSTGAMEVLCGGFSILPRYGFGRIWVARTDPPAIIAVDPTTGNVTDTLSAGTSGVNFPNSICITDKRVYFNDALAGRVGYIEPSATQPPIIVWPAGLANVAPLGTLPSAISMRGMCWDGKNVWAGVSTSPVGFAKKIDQASNTVIATVTLGDTPFYGPAFDAVGNKIWWPNFVSNTATKIDCATNATTTIATNPGPWGFFCNGSRMFLSENVADTIAFYSTAGLDGGRWNLPAGSGLHDIVIVRNELWVSQSSQDKIFVFDHMQDTGTVSPIRNFSVGPTASDPAGMCYVPPNVWWMNAQGDGGGASPASKLKAKCVDHRY